MSTPDEKKNVIVPLLDILRRYNPGIGLYDKSMMNMDFNYAVRLSNGSIELANEIVTDFEKDSAAVSEDRYKSEAKRFTSTTPPVQVATAKPVGTPIPPKEKKRMGIWGWIVTLIIVVFVAGLIGWVVDVVDSQSNLNRWENREKTPEELRVELKMKEQQNPQDYLTHSGKWHQNFWDDFVMEGTISNSATMANFKDIQLEVTFKSKTETPIKTAYYTIYEFVGAGNSINYKLNPAGVPSATAGITVSINTATPVN